jgi:hypothetical protein
MPTRDIPAPKDLKSVLDLIIRQNENGNILIACDLNKDPNNVILTFQTSASGT